MKRYEQINILIEGTSCTGSLQVIADIADTDARRIANAIEPYEIERDRLRNEASRARNKISELAQEAQR